MDSTFARVKSIIDRLRDAMKCQKCLQFKKENSMMFYHICDHFYCDNCIGKDRSCPLCENPLDKPTKVLNDKNILSLYQSLLNFELPSKDDVERIYKNHKASKGILMNLEKGMGDGDDAVPETPKNQRRGKSILRTESIERGKRKTLDVTTYAVQEEKTSLAETESASTDNTPKKKKSIFKNASTMEQKNILSVNKGGKNSTPAGRGKSTSKINTTPAAGVGKTSATPATHASKTNNTPGAAAKNKTTPDTVSGGQSKTSPTTTPVSASSSRRSKITPNVTPVGRVKTPVVPTSAGSSKNKGSASKLNVNKRNPKGETQLHLACKKSNFSAMAELIAAGANPNAQDNAGWTPLHDSVFSANVEVIKFLLDNGAKVNTPGLENTTALHEAIAKGNIKIVKLLLEYGADIKAMNIFKETPLDLVTKYELGELKDILLEAEKNAKGKSGGLRLEEEPDENIVIYVHNLSIEDEKLVNKFVDKFKGNLISSVTLKSPVSHIVVPKDKFEITWTIISSVLSGCWIVTPDWIKDSLKEDTPKPAIGYEPPKDLFCGFAKARTNKLNQLPGIFSGCHFFFGGNFESYCVKNVTVRKEDLKQLVEKHGGVTLKRCPDPESLALEKTIPFHADATSSIRETSYFIIYQTDKWDPKPKYNMSHMKTLPIDWLIASIFKFELIDPLKNVSCSDFL